MNNFVNMTSCDTLIIIVSIYIIYMYYTDKYDGVDSNENFKKSTEFQFICKLKKIKICT